MDGLTLLQRAQEAGLAVQAKGDKLVIRGPKRAEPVALLLLDHKPDVLAVLSPRSLRDPPLRDWNAADRTLWRDRYAARIVHWFRGGRPWQEAEQLAFGEMILEWHRRFGARLPPGCCAGCGGDLPDGAGLVVNCDGARVHFEGVRGVDCIIAFGIRWRGTAVAGLQAAGLQPPEGFAIL